MSNGYIYIKLLDSYNFCKLGKTKNIYNKSNIITIFEISENLINIIYTLLKNKFNNLNIRYDKEETEYFQKDIIQLIEPYLDSIDISYRKLTK
jgi:hypothetical protein